MPSQIGKLKWIFLALFFAASASITIYQWVWVIPRQKCEAAKDWWSPKDMKCYTPIYIPSITGRKPGVSAVIDWHDGKAAPVNTSAAATPAASAASAVSK